MQYGALHPGLMYVQPSGGEAIGLSSIHIFENDFVLNSELIYASTPFGSGYITESNNRINSLYLRVSSSNIDKKPEYSGWYFLYGLNIKYFTRKAKQTKAGEIEANSGVNSGIHGGGGYSYNFKKLTKYELLLDFHLTYDWQFIGNLDSRSRVIGYTFLIGLYFPI